MLKITTGKITMEAVIDGRKVAMSVPAKVKYVVAGREFVEGARVWWLKEEKRGWGGTRRIAATIVRATPKRVVIDVEYKDGHHEEKSIKPERVETGAPGGDMRQEVESALKKERLILAKLQLKQ